MIKGHAHKYGNNVDTDVIIPARYLNCTDPAELAIHCMEDIDKSFVKNVRPGDIMVAGENFGCGSSREHAPLAIKNSGINLIIAESFARIFYRNSINIGLPILECKEAALDIDKGDEVSADLSTGVIINHTKNKKYTAIPFPDFINELIKSGGLMNYVTQNGGKL
jgi:3-isopropylmalate/(R)-2-methylmalate dehydratase small subunit